MDIETLRLKIYEMNEDEIFYRDYYYARQQSYSLEKFLANLNMEDVLRRHLLIPEKPETIPLQYEDTFFFEMNNTNSIIAQKHNRYAPAIFHKHTFFELMYVYDGHCQQKFAHTEFHLKTGDICIIPPGIEHTISLNDESIVFNILIRKNTLHNIFYNFLSTPNILSSFFLSNIYAEKGNDYIIFHTGSDLEIQRGFLYMLWETTNKEMYHYQMISYTLMLVFGLLIRNYENTVDMPIFTKRVDVQRFALLQYIQEHYTDIRLENVAKHFHYTPEYTSKLIKETTGMTFTEIIQRIRIEKAQEMLQNTNLSIATISEKVGYDAPEYFIRLFKKNVQMTPSVYRKTYTSS
ncbi:AraC family cel operon transcriptional repressor [Lachnospiraceae bacterium PF1-21]|uniref:AraC family transcriptional regulator n=1 Tax=Ohessyouella blattaphilus TaxID=2949333 RepID=A0ABT1EKN7_9FIRM|nr:AraC family transcriptional regulator [Ohessyouella blattaphilus]MCP1111049.1 AraC family transcriptional regulator [Ohessyouella blattaphilus]MCR8564443.1 AraC family transcriptional regulator [Ohessyouella blattaphilus]MDL2250460.1 AraC family transcriptional regulator [Lachnospiraceae bacterium OttesenSCG-928-J05]